MNPFDVINPYLHELVLQHFIGNEILKSVSLVSPDWYEIAGKSRKCMNKVKFLYQVWRHQFYSSTEVFYIAASSCRKYQHVTVELGVNDDLRQFWKFMENCCDSLITLKVENVRRWGNLVELEFPNLEVFKASSLDEKSLTTFIKAAEKLKDFYVFSGESQVEQSLIDSLVSCLERNKNLEELYLKNVNFLQVFEDELQVKFNLKSFKLLNSSSKNSIAPEIQANILKFLKQQQSTLETFFFEFSSDEIVEFVFSLSAVTSLGLLNVPPTGNLKKNLKIKSLEIPFVEEFSNVKKVIDASPNIESLFVANVTNELIDYLAWNFMRLTSLNFKSISLESEEHYEKLKQENSEVNREIDIWDYENVDWD